MSALLQVEGLTKRFGGVVALDDVSFSVERGAIVSLIGPNGAGKTTLFNCVSGVTRAAAGRVRLSDATLPSQPHEVARTGIARTFQNIRLFTRMTVLENVLVGTLVRTHTGLAQAMDRAERLLERLGLAEAAGRAAGALSYGQQRRVELARALASDPELLLLDEPAAGLAFSEKQGLMDFLRQLRREGMTVLLIEHDMKVVMPVSDRVVVLDYGAKIAEGTPDHIQQDPAVIEAYLGARPNGA